jgi:hypothetical protein
LEIFLAILIALAALSATSGLLLLLLTRLLLPALLLLAGLLLPATLLLTGFLPTLLLLTRLIRIARLVRILSHHCLPSSSPNNNSCARVSFRDLHLRFDAKCFEFNRSDGACAKCSEYNHVSVPRQTFCGNSASLRNGCVSKRSRRSSAGSRKIGKPIVIFCSPAIGAAR